MKKKLLTLALLSTVTVLGIAACGGGNSSSEQSNVEESSEVVSSNVEQSSEVVVSSEEEVSSEEVISSEDVVSSEEEVSSEVEESSSELEPSDPVINLTSESDINVVAGVEVALPSYTATDYDGTDLTEDVEIEDTLDSGTIINGGTAFKSEIAGTHVINYYVESDTGLYCEKNINVIVSPVNEENFDVTGANDPAVITTYGTFKENFAAAKKNALGVSDANSATHYTATTDAIAGNSLVIDTNKTAGSAANQVFFNGFNDFFNKGTQVSYSFEFDYKFITNNNNTGDVYASLMWDGTTGLNVNGLVADGDVHHFAHTWAQVSLPEGSNAWFSIWKLGIHEDPAIMVVDNVVVKAIECAQVTTYIPTAAEMEAGVTWDFVNKAFSTSNGEVLITRNIEDETIRTALQGNDAFHENTLQLTSTDDHLMDCLNNDNLVGGKVLNLSFTYYNVNDGGFHLIMMQPNGNTLDKYVTVTDLGNGFKKAELSFKLPNGCVGLNIYGAGNANFNIYIGELTAKLDEPEEEPEVGQGDTLIEDFYGIDGADASIATWDAGTRTISSNALGDDVTLWFSINADFLKAGQKYIAKFDLTFSEGFQADSLHIRNASQFDKFSDAVNTAGKQSYAAHFTMVNDGSFFGLYMVNVKGDVKVSKLVVSVDDKVVISNFYGMNDGNTAAHSWDASTRTVSMDGTAADATLWLSTGADFLKSGKSYIYKFSVTYADGFTGTKACIRYDSREFDDFQVGFSAGKVDYTLTKTMTADGGFFGIYFLGCAGSCVVSDFTIEEDKAIHVDNFYGMNDGNTAAHSWDASTRTVSMDGTAADATLWLSTGADFLKAGKSYVYKFSITYTEGFTGTKACIRYDSREFDDFQVGFSAGKVDYELCKTMTADGGFFGIYFLGCAGSCVVSGLTIEEDTSTHLSDFFGMDGGENDAHRYDKNTRTVSMNGIANDATLWFSIAAGDLLKAGKSYTIKFSITYAAGFTGTKACLRYDGAFDDFEFDFSARTVNYSIDKDMTADGGFWGIYFLGCTGSCVVSDVRIIAK